jgi:hypothetical protein
LITTSLAENIQLALHVRPAFPMFGYEQQTTGIGNQCDECDSHHHQRFRLTTEYKASHHLYEHAHSQDQLQYTSKMRGTYLHFHAMSNRIKGKPYTAASAKLSRDSPIRPVDRAIRPAVISTTNRSALMPGNQRRSRILAAKLPALGDASGLRICSDGFRKRGA